MVTKAAVVPPEIAPSCVRSARARLAPESTPPTPRTASAMKSHGLGLTISILGSLRPPAFAARGCAGAAASGARGFSSAVVIALLLPRSRERGTRRSREAGRMVALRQPTSGGSASRLMLRPQQVEHGLDRRERFFRDLDEDRVPARHRPVPEARDARARAAWRRPRCARSGTRDSGRRSRRGGRGARVDRAGRGRAAPG